MQVEEALKTGIAQSGELLKRAEAATDEQEKIDLLAAAVHAGSHGLNVANDIKVGKQVHANLTADEMRKAAIPEHLQEVVAEKPEAAASNV